MSLTKTKKKLQLTLAKEKMKLSQKRGFQQILQIGFQRIKIKVYRQNETTNLKRLFLH